MISFATIAGIETYDGDNYYRLSLSRAVLALWQGQHNDCRFDGSSVPPCAIGMMWSTHFAVVAMPFGRHP